MEIDGYKEKELGDLISLFFIINIGKTTLFCAIAFLRRCCQTASGFHFFGFRNNLFLQSKIVSPASNPQPGGPGKPHFIFFS
jgi:hypothetical protein